jgi:cytochrome P450
MGFSNTLKGKFTSTPVLRFAFGFLRNVRPVAVFGKNAFVTKYRDVAEVLSNESDFTVYEIDGYKMEAMGNPFILGMDASPETTRDRKMLQQVIKREDLANIRTYMQQLAIELINDSTYMGKVQVVNEYARLAMVRLVAHYFGVPADEQDMMRWQRSIFNEAFVNLNNDPEIHAKGMIASKEVAAWISGLIKERKTHADDLEDNVLNRLIKSQKDNEWLDDKAVLRNILCILGVVENTSKVVVHVMDQLLKRPDEFKLAKIAAISGDMETVKNYCFEALRFNPHNPAILRFCKKGAIIGKGTKNERKIPAGTTVYAATLGAMFDPEKVKDPKKFDPNRNVDYMHFGYGPHTCTGKYISEITAPELVAALLRLPNLKRADGTAGKIQYDEMVFPDSFILTYG